MSQIYDKRHQRLVEGPESYLNIRRSGADLDYRDFADNNPAAQALEQLQKLDPTLISGGRNSPKKVHGKFKRKKQTSLQVLAYKMMTFILNQCLMSLVIDSVLDIPGSLTV